MDCTDVDSEVVALPLDASSVDPAISLVVIEHLRNPENFLSELFRYLKPGELVYLSTPSFKLDWKNFYSDPTYVRYTHASL